MNTAEESPEVWARKMPDDELLEHMVGWASAERPRAIANEVVRRFKARSPVATDATATLQTTVDPLWFDHCLSADVFRRDYSGLWAAGIEYDEKLGWLVFEHGDEVRPPAKVPAKVLTAWRTGRGQSQGRWHRLDRAAAIRAWEAGVRRGGESWFENGDGPAYDAAVQMALLGEVRYG